MRNAFYLAALVAAAAFAWPHRARIEREYRSRAVPFLRETGLIEEEAPPDPALALPGAGDLAAPDRSPRRPQARRGRTARRFSAVGNDKPIPLGGEMRSLETARLEAEDPSFVASERGRGALLFVGISAFFGLMAYVLIGLKKRTR